MQGVKPIIETDQKEKAGKEQLDKISSPPFEASLLPSSIKRILRFPYLTQILGLLVALGIILWLALPSRLPSLGIFGLVFLAGFGRFFYFNPAKVQVWSRIWLRPEKLALFLILLLAFLLRFAGLRQSLPYFDNPDEPTMVNGALKILQTGDFNPHYFRWPSLPIYSQFLVSIPTFFGGVSAATIKNLSDIPTENFFLVGRAVSALLGIGTVFLTFLAGRKLFGIGVGLVAALILAILPLHSENSQYVTPDAMVVFFATLTFLFAIYIFKTGEKGWYLWAGVAAGLTVGSKYNVAIVLFTVFLAHFLSLKERRGKVTWLLGTLSLTGLVFLVTTPFSLLDLPGFLNDLAFQVRHYTLLGHGSASEEASWSAYLVNIYEEAFVFQASILLVGSILFALFRQKREDWLVLSFPAVGFLFFSSARVHFSRNLVPLLPPLAIMAAVLLLFLAAQLNLFILQKLKIGWRASLLAWITPLVIFLMFFAFSIQHTILTDRYYLQMDTRVRAGDWMVANLPAGAKIRLEPQTPILPPGRFPNSEERRPVGSHPLDWYRDQGFKYLVVSSYYYREEIAADPSVGAIYQSLFQNGHLLKEFPGESKDYPGPTIKIFKVD